MNTSLQCIENGSEPKRAICPYCQVAFEPKRPWQAFCSAAHRDAYHAEIGMSGRVAAVRRLKMGVSVVMHLEGPAAERAINLEIGTIVRLVKKP